MKVIINKIELEMFLIWRDNQSMIAIDRVDCFDKIWKCPILVRLPKTEKEIKELDKKINWLSTKDGYKVSNGYKTDKWINEYSD